uniref:Uncharacterized protein MANES_04G135600 n=1 Tax=Rhizophora mucronata TaxID=61149 RepID=A0A2P2MJJ1_RHIMU
MNRIRRGLSKRYATP